MIYVSRTTKQDKTHILAFFRKLLVIQVQRMFNVKIELF